MTIVLTIDDLLTTSIVNKTQFERDGEIIAALVKCSTSC